MKAKFIKYAEKHINVTASENGLKAFSDNSKLYLEMNSGKTYQLANEEILYQANEYLLNEIEELLTEF